MVDQMNGELYYNLSTDLSGILTNHSWSTALF